MLNSDEINELKTKIKNITRTKLRLKNNLNVVIDELKKENTDLKQENEKLKQQLEKLKWADEWDNI